jgi:hypothetical protein
LQWNPRVQIACGELKRLRQHTDDGVGDRIQSQDLTDRASVPAEFSLPEAVAEHDDCGLLFGRGEQSSRDRLGLNDPKELWCGSDDEQLLGVAGAGHDRPPERIARKRFDQLAVLAPGKQAWIRGDVAIATLLRIGHPDHRCALGLAIWQRVDQHGFPHTEDGRRQGNSDCNGTNRHRREPSLAPDQTKRKSKILRQDERVLFGSVREDRGNSAQKHDDPRDGSVFGAEPVYQEERHLPPVLVTVRGWVEMQYGCEQRTGPAFNTCDGHRYRLRGSRPLARASASRRVSLVASDSATRRPNAVRR